MGCNLALLKDLFPETELIKDSHIENLDFDFRIINKNTLTFCGSESFLKESIQLKNISAIITTREIYSSCKQELDRISKGIILSSKPSETFFRFHNHLFYNTDFYNIKKKKSIGKNCNISKLAYISDDNVNIGDYANIEDFVRINSNVKIGNNCVIGAGSIIGNQGFQFIKLPDEIVPVAHAGGVLIGNDVEIRSNCVIDKHIFKKNTSIGDQTKLDNLVYLAHMSIIGKRCLIGSHAVINGNTIIGNNSWIGPGAVISDSLTIGENVFVSLGSVVTKDLKTGEKVTGNFAIPHEKFINNLKKIR